MSTKDLTVLLATWRRSAILHQTLSAMARMDAGPLAWELIVVDNAGDEDTRRVCDAFGASLPLRYLVCTRPGKSAALNAGLALVSGELVVLTDDDVLPEPTWLLEMARGAARWPGHVLFGGRVVPYWPTEPPPGVRDPGWDRWTYGVYDPDLPEGPSASSFPMGANMAVRRSVFQAGLGFDEGIGPNGQHYAMGNELDLIRRIMARGGEPVFLPCSRVAHIIRPEQTRPEWLIGRAFRHGRGEVRLRAELSWLETARLAKHATARTAGLCGALLRRGRPGSFRERMACSISRGRIYEALRRKLLRW